MKVSNEYLKQVIKEETERVLEESEIDEGLWDRIKGKAQSGWQGLKGGIKSKVAGGIGKAASMAGLSGVADAASQAKSGIQAQTASRQIAVKMRQAVLPKLNDMEKDMKALAKTPQEQNNPVFKTALEAIESLKTDLNDLFTKAGMQSPEMKKAQKQAAPPEQQDDLGGVSGPSEE